MENKRWSTVDMLIGIISPLVVSTVLWSYSLNVDIADLKSMKANKEDVQQQQVQIIKSINVLGTKFVLSNQLIKELTKSTDKLINTLIDMDNRVRNLEIRTYKGGFKK